MKREPHNRPALASLPRAPRAVPRSCSRDIRESQRRAKPVHGDLNSLQARIELDESRATAKTVALAPVPADRRQGILGDPVVHTLVDELQAIGEGVVS